MNIYNFIQSLSEKFIFETVTDENIEKIKHYLTEHIREKYPELPGYNRIEIQRNLIVDLEKYYPEALI